MRYVPHGNRRAYPILAVPGLGLAPQALDDVYLRGADRVGR